MSRRELTNDDVIEHLETMLIAERGTGRSMPVFAQCIARVKELANPWRPIETAPKDQIVDIWCRSFGRMPQCQWEKPDAVRDGATLVDGMAWCDQDSEWGAVAVISPSHWMPETEGPETDNEQ